MSAGLVILLLASRVFAANFEDKIDAALERAGDVLLRQLSSNNSITIGERALFRMAVYECGITIDLTGQEFPKNAPPQYATPYNAGLWLRLLEKYSVGEAQNSNYALDIKTLVDDLLRSQKADGGWGDVSRTGFALMGLASAVRSGQKVDRDVFLNAHKYLQATASKNGGWPYKQGGHTTGSMSAAAVLAMHDIGHSPSSNLCGNAVNWLSNNFSAKINPGAALNRGEIGHRFYYLWRMAELISNMNLASNKSWQQKRIEIIKTLLAEQQPNGAWRGEMQDYPTAFAVLALSALQSCTEPPMIKIAIFAPNNIVLQSNAAELLESATRFWRARPMAFELVRITGRNLRATTQMDFDLVMVVSAKNVEMSQLESRALGRLAQDGVRICIEPINSNEANTAIDYAKTIAAGMNSKLLPRKAKNTANNLAQQNTHKMMEWNIRRASIWTLSAPIFSTELSSDEFYHSSERAGALTVLLSDVLSRF